MVLQGEQAMIAKHDIFILIFFKNGLKGSKFSSVPHDTVAWRIENKWLDIVRKMWKVENQKSL